MQKRVLAVSDISCLGKCALTTALPVLSACGHECVLLPTAVLSTHTAADFGDYTCEDLTHRLLPILQHWQRLEITFDAVYIGYLTTPAQAALLTEQLPKLCREDTLWLVDPILGDNGQLYRGLSAENIAALRRLCQRADIITPNLTEAALLLEEEYQPHPTPEQVEGMLVRLRKLGAKNPVITGASREEGMTGAAAFDGISFHWAQTPAYPRAFYGTGDVFSSALLTGLMNGKNLAASVDLAVGFTHEAIRHTLSEGRPLRYGPCFEKALPWLMGNV